MRSPDGSQLAHQNPEKNAFRSPKQWKRRRKGVRGGRRERGEKPRRPCSRGNNGTWPWRGGSGVRKRPKEWREGRRVCTVRTSGARGDVRAPNKAQSIVSIGRKRLRTRALLSFVRPPSRLSYGVFCFSLFARLPSHSGVSYVRRYNGNRSRLLLDPIVRRVICSRPSSAHAPEPAVRTTTRFSSPVRKSKKKTVFSTRFARNRFVGHTEKNEEEGLG